MYFPTYGNMTTAMHATYKLHIYPSPLPPFPPHSPVLVSAPFVKARVSSLASAILKALLLVLVRAPPLLSAGPSTENVPLATPLPPPSPDSLPPSAAATGPRAPLEPLEPFEPLVAVCPGGLVSACLVPLVEICVQ